MSCTKGAISGFVFAQQDAGRLRERDLLPGPWNSAQGDGGQLRLAWSTCVAVQQGGGGEGAGQGRGGSREGWPQGSQSSPATSFPSRVQPLFSLGVIYHQNWHNCILKRVSNHESTMRWVELFFSISQKKKLRLIDLFVKIITTV